MSTMALSMQAAVRKGIPFVVLDRPNRSAATSWKAPCLTQPSRRSSACTPSPARHGMTVGELATLFNRQQGIGADLTVVPAQGCAAGGGSTKRVCLGEPVTQPPIAGGRDELPRHGLLRGHQSLGAAAPTGLRAGWAPWLDAAAVVATMNAMGLPGIAFQAVTVSVADTAAKFPGQNIPPSG